MVIVLRFSRSNFENAYWNIVDTTYTEVFGMGFFFTSYDDMHSKEVNKSIAL